MTSVTRSVLAAVKGTPSARSARTSSPSRNGLPPVASWQARANASSTGPCSRRSRPTPSSSSAGGSIRNRRRVLADRRKRALLRGAGRDQQRDRERLHPPGDVREEAQRRLVGPVRVVDHEQHRCLVGKAGDQPVEAVEDPDRGGLERLRDVEQDRSGQPGRPSQEPLTIGFRPDRRLQALAGHAQRVLALQLGAARVEHPHAALGRALARRRQQARLADARRPLDQQHRPRPRARLGQQPLEGRELLIALDQCHLPTLIAATAQVPK